MDKYSKDRTSTSSKLTLCLSVLTAVVTIIFFALTLREIFIMHQKIHNLTQIIEDLQMYRTEYAHAEAHSQRKMSKRSVLHHGYSSEEIRSRPWLSRRSQHQKFNWMSSITEMPHPTTTPASALPNSLKEKTKLLNPDLLGRRPSEEDSISTTSSSLAAGQAVVRDNETGGYGRNLVPDGARADIITTPSLDELIDREISKRLKENSNFIGPSSTEDRFDKTSFSVFNRRETSIGSTFIRWGLPSCPQESSTVYSGFAAAANPASGFGGSTELECLSSDPTWNANSSSSIVSKTQISAAKFHLGSHANSFIPGVDNSVIQCAVCLSTRTPVLMVPGQIECPDQWRREFFGYLMSTPGIASQYFFSSKNYCVDSASEPYPGQNDAHGLKLTFVQPGDCFNNDPLCTKYTTQRVLGCAVCSRKDNSES